MIIRTLCSVVALATVAVAAAIASIAPAPFDYGQFSK